MVASARQCHPFGAARRWPWRCGETVHSSDRVGAVANPGPGRRAAGFTLLEMLAVILLIGIAAAAVSLSVTHGLSGARVRAASTDLAAALRYTRAQAIVHARQEALEVDLQARSYRAPGRDAVTLPQGMGLAVTSAAEDQSGGHVARIRFFPDGSSTGGHITLSRGRRTWQVDVAWLTGAVRVVAGTGS